MNQIKSNFNIMINNIFNLELNDNSLNKSKQKLDFDG